MSHTFNNDSLYTMSQWAGTQLLSATSLVQSQPQCCRTLVVNLWHKSRGWHKGQGGKRSKPVSLAKISPHFRITHIT